MSNAAEREQTRQSNQEERAANLQAATLRAYADLFDSLQRDSLAETLTITHFTPEVYAAAARALRIQADALERGSDY